MGEPKIGSHPELFLSINDSPNLGDLFEKFEWRSFTNGGYAIRAKLADSYWNILTDLIKDYMKKGRQGPMKVIFELIWPGAADGGDLKTGRRLAYLADMDAKGIQAGGALEFIAIDPPSYWLNAGDSSGRVYKGKIGGDFKSVNGPGVIAQVVQDYFINPSDGKADVEVSETADNIQNQWWMMRMDPKTFIASLLDWSSSITEQKTNWVVASGGTVDKPTIYIKEQAKMPTVNYGLYVLDTNTAASNDIYNFEFLSDNIISVFQKQIITSGISSVSERFFDRKLDPQRKIVHVFDDDTAAKKKTKLDKDHGFAKPAQNPSPEKPHEWSTHIMAIPQHSAGDVGVTYDRYIDGRARNLFLQMLNLAMRIKIRVTGESSPILADSKNLGVSKLKIAWKDPVNSVYFLDGDWLVYGFHHIVRRGGEWTTDIYCARLDFNAEAQIV